MRILLVEDDGALIIGIEYALKKENFEVVVAKNIEEARVKIRNKIDLLLLDIMLPDGSGYDFCKEVRKYSDVPIIFMTALEDEPNVMLGLDIGGDDYIIKPVRVGELVSRINALMRRKNKWKSDGSRNIKISEILTGDLKIEPLKCKVSKLGEEILLTQSEYRLLILFIENKGNVIKRDTILQKLWDVDGNFVEVNNLNVYIKRLREKIEDDIKNPRYIETVRGIGYRWKEEVESIGAI